MLDVFQEARRLVSAREIAELNGLHPNRRGFVCCPLHHEKTGSLKLYDDGHWHCFGCNRGGSSIDLMAALYDLTPLDAVRRLDADFHLNLPLDKPPDTATVAAAQHRQAVNDTYQAFQVWRDDLTRQLNTCFRLAHLATKDIASPADLDRLSASQVLAVQWQHAFEYWADTLTNGEMSEIMAVFRERGTIQSRIDQILNHSPMKSGAA